MDAGWGLFQIATPMREFHHSSPTRVITLRSPLAQAVRNQVAMFMSSLDVVQHRLAQALSGLVRNYRKTPMVGEYHRGFLGVVTGVFPTKGMSLPFISAGLSNLLLMGMLLGVILNTQRTWGRAALPERVRTMREVMA